MAERRMFAKTIVTSDAFLDMPMSARCLYFTLGMFADDDGFVNNPKSIMRQVGATLDDMNILIGKKFILVFESGVIVIKHWRINNYLRSDRYKETAYREEKADLHIEENGAYTLGVPDGIPVVDQCETQYRLGKDSIGIYSNPTEDNVLPVSDKGKGKSKKKNANKDSYGEFKNVMLSKDEFEKIKEKFPKDWSDRIESLSEYMRSKGKTYKDHYATILSWARKEERENKGKPKQTEPKKYKVFEKEYYERDDFEAVQMPDDIRNKLGGMFNAG